MPAHFVFPFERHNHDAAEKVCVPKMGSEDNLESKCVCMKYENENVRGIKSMGESEEREVHPPKKLVYLKFDSRKIWNRTISA